MRQRSCFLSSMLLLAAIANLANGSVQTEQMLLSRPDSEAASIEKLAFEPSPGKVLSGYRLTVKRAVTPFYMTQLVSSIDEPVAAGDRLQLRFWARSTTSDGHPVRVDIELSRPPFDALAEDTPTFGPAWKLYEASGTSRRAYARGELSYHFQIGQKPGVVELAGVTFKDLGIDPGIEKSRKALTPAAIARRIQTYRTTGFCVRVVDSKGHAVPGARVSVDQVRHEFLFGSNIFGLDTAAKSDPLQAGYQARFAGLFNYATLPFYWGAFEPTQGHEDYPKLEAMATWCQEHGITCKGHPLAWHQVYPDWAPKDESVVPILKARIDEIIRRFSDKILCYDVFNEINDAAATDTGVGAWVKKVGKAQALETALDWARKADPARPHVFLYNDYQTSTSTVNLLEELQRDGKLPDAIGIQSHMHGGNWPMENLWTTVERFARFGRPIHFTETTVLSGPIRNDIDDNHPPTDWVTSPEMEKVQADYVEQFYTVLFSHPSVKAITWWDLSDRNAWRNAPAGLIRKDMSPKPAYERLMNLVHGKWWTKVKGATNAAGQFKSRVFRGIQRVTIAVGKKAPIVRQVVVTGAGEQTFIVKI